MKLEIKLLILKNITNNEVIDVLPIEDMYAEVQVTYPAGTVSIDNILEWGRAVWGNRVFDKCSEYLTAVEKGEDFSIEGQAIDVPSLGVVQMYTNTITLDTDDLDL